MHTFYTIQETRQFLIIIATAFYCELIGEQLLPLSSLYFCLCHSLTVLWTSISRAELKLYQLWDTHVRHAKVRHARCHNTGVETCSPPPPRLKLFLVTRMAAARSSALECEKLSIGQIDLIDNTYHCERADKTKKQNQPQSISICAEQ